MTDAVSSVIEFRDVTRRYRARRSQSARTALRNLSLTVRIGETLAVLGPNGSGKSTMLSLALGLDRPDEGSVLLLGSAPTEIPRREGCIAAVHQTPSLDPLLTVRENLALHATLYGQRDHARRVPRLAAVLGLSDRLDDRVSTLSGGLARRADIARAWLSRPRLLVLDEPAVGLDIAARRELADVIFAREELPSESAVIIATHHAEIAERADAVVFLDRGKLVLSGPPREVCSRVAGGQSCVRTAMHADVPGEFTVNLSRHFVSDRVVFAGDPDHVSRLAGILAGAGTPFETGPTNLQDAYLIASGRSLVNGSTDGTEAG